MNSEITKQTADVSEGKPQTLERDPRGGNPEQHGILSSHVPASEREAYAQHAQAIREASGAQNYLEQRLADRAALAFWRLDRVARWEVAEQERDQRRFFDGLETGMGKSSKAPNMEELMGVPINARGLEGSLWALSELTGEAQSAFLSDLQLAERYAQDLEAEGLAWQAIMDGTDPATLSGEAAETLSHDLVSALQEIWDVEDSRIARVITGRKPTRDEVEAVTESYWEFEPSTLALLVKEAQRVAGEAWRGWLVKKRYGLSGKAGKVRAIGARVPMLLEQEQARALEPDTKRLEKLIRYEAHLERVLYRSLHELEAARRGREGQDTPGPLRMVLEVPEHDR